jgi:hypothetical protein
MKTLHNIFHKNLFKNYFKILIGTVVCLLIGIFTEELKEKNTLIIFVISSTFLLAAFGPLLIFYNNANFPHNVKYLINQHFNRFELLQFFFFSQTLKIIFAAVNYSVLYLLQRLFSKGSEKIPDLFELNFTYSNYFIYFILLLCGIYIFYFSALFSVNKKDVQRNQVAQIAFKKEIKLQWLATFGLIFIISYLDVPYFIIGCFVSLLIAFPTLIILNRTFKLYHQKKSYMLSSMGSFVMCLPLVVIFFGMKNEAQDTNLSYKSRANSVIYLKGLNSSFSNEQMLGFLANIDNWRYHQILKLFGDKVDFNSSLNLVDSELRGKRFIDFHSRKYPQEKVKAIVQHMSKLMVDKKLKFRFAQYSHSFFKLQKVEESYIYELAASNHPYKQLASIYFAKNSFNKEKFLSFYEQNRSLFDKVILDDSFVKRSIASMSQNNKRAL